jgi:hypothetical protein
MTIQYVAGVVDGLAAPTLTLVSSNQVLNSVNMSLYGFASSVYSVLQCNRTVRVGVSTTCTVATFNSNNVAVNVYTPDWSIQAGAVPLVVPVTGLSIASVYGVNVTFSFVPALPLGTQAVRVILPGNGGTLSTDIDVIDMPDATSVLQCDTLVPTGSTAFCAFLPRQLGSSIFSSWSLLSLSDSLTFNSASFTLNAPSNSRNLTVLWLAPSVAQSVVVNVTSNAGVLLGTATINVYTVPDSTSTITCPSLGKWYSTVQCTVTPRLQSVVSISSLNAFGLYASGAGAVVHPITSYGSALSFNVTLNGGLGLVKIGSSVCNASNITVWTTPDASSGFSDFM